MLDSQNEIITLQHRAAILSWNQRSTGRGFTPPRPAADLSRNFQRRGGGGASSNLAVSPSFDNIILF